MLSLVCGAAGRQVYQIEVVTQSEQWSVYRRYSEFAELQAAMTKLLGTTKGLLPGKKLTGNLSPDLLEERRQGLEHFLQRLVTSTKDMAAAAPLLTFLDVDSHVRGRRGQLFV